ncbi:DUF5361 domain-containing protein [Rhodococcus jostii]|uniref:DUF5361 domain-containing protein n=1 Tax=Rhodococcus jostii TaxID=132919 RepID=UPI0036411948
MTALLALMDEHREAIESDLLDRGLRLSRLGTPDLLWSELKSVVKRALGDPYSALFRSVDPDSAGWGKRELLLAELIDTARWLKWAKTPDGQRNLRHPKPIPRPGVEKPEVLGTDAVPIDEMDTWLGWSA